MSSAAFLALLEDYAKKGWILGKSKTHLKQLCESYKRSLKEHGLSTAQMDPLFTLLLDLIKKQTLSAFIFQPYHKLIREPFDYYQFGIDFILPLVDPKASSVSGNENAHEILSHLKASHNVILLANHQTEADPQAISILLQKEYPLLATEMIFVAGERVVTDPLAVPFSMGRNLLCIYSKRYIDHPPELKEKKQQHNQRTMQLMSVLLSEGGKCVYVAPSGGRDRPNSEGEVEIASFDPQSIEMLYLMAKKSNTPTFFYPLTLLTYDLLPPPQTIQVELGEERSTKRAGIHLVFGKQIDMEHFPGSEQPVKKERRKLRADYIWNLVNQDYHKLQKKRSQ